MLAECAEKLVFGLYNDMDTSPNTRPLHKTQVGESLLDYCTRLGHLLYSLHMETRNYGPLRHAGTDACAVPGFVREGALRFA